MYNPQLETFIRVADAGSFNKAAEELFISPPAVIKQINLLEAQLGLTLFVRTHRGLKLTEAGKSLYQDAKYVIGYCRESVERARAAMQKEENVIRIGTSPMTPVQNMVDLWPKFQEVAAVLRCIGQPSVSEEKAFDDTGFVWGKLIVDAPWLEPLH